jgi:hypothetical protein
MGVNMFDNFEQFEPSAATKYAKRVDRFLNDWVPKNRPVIDEFTRLAKQIRGKRSHYGAQAIFEIMRYHSIVREQGTEYGMNNNSVALLARYVMIKNSELKDFFDLRTISGLPEARAHSILIAGMVRKGEYSSVQGSLF